jgi:hypothetical protein
MLPGGRELRLVRLPMEPAVLALATLCFVFGLPLHGQLRNAPDCADLLQKQAPGTVATCKAQVDEAEKAPATERMARIIANDNYGVALLAVAHKPSQAIDAFNRAILLLPGSTVKTDSLQWAVAFWHRATAYQQQLDWNHAASDLLTAENTFSKAISSASGDTVLTQHFTELRHRVRAQRAEMLIHLGKRSEAQKLLATQ